MLIFYIVSVLVVLTYCVGVALWINWDEIKANRPVRSHDVRRRVQDADRQVQLAHQVARRQMNEGGGAALAQPGRLRS